MASIHSIQQPNNKIPRVNPRLGFASRGGVDCCHEGGAQTDCESVSVSERQDEKQMPRETGSRQGRTPPTGDPHRAEDPAEDPPPEGWATQGTHTEHTQTSRNYVNACSIVLIDALHSI